MARKKKGSNRWIWIVLLIVVVSVVAVFMFRDKGRYQTKVTAEPVKKRTIIEKVSATGKVYPEVEVEITSEVSGTIVELTVAEGDSVQEGQLLAKIDPEAIESIVERTEAAAQSSRAQLESSRAQVQQLEAQYENTMRVHNRNEQLYEEGVISQADFEASEAALKTAAANLEAAKQNVQSASYNVKSALATVKEQRENLSRTAIYAPMTGTISELYKKKGEQVVGTAQMAGTPILKIANLSAIEVRVDVSETDILRVQIGDTAEIEVDAHLDGSFLGVVTQIAQSAANLSGMQLTSDQVTNFEVRIRLLPSSYKELMKSKQSPFLPGMSAAADIRTKEVADVLTLPISAVTTRTTDDLGIEQEEEERREVVFAIQGDTVDLREVSIGIQDNKYIQITKGLVLGDSVVTGPYSAISRNLNEGDPVKVVDKKELLK